MKALAEDTFHEDITHKGIGNLFLLMDRYREDETNVICDRCGRELWNHSTGFCILVFEGRKESGQFYNKELYSNKRFINFYLNYLDKKITGDLL